nr:alpha/beta fold hydrolase [Lysinibacter cavernae]
MASRPLMILLHGYGSFEGDLIGLADHLPKQFVLASLRAPLIAPPPVVDGYSWFPIDPAGPDPKRGAEAAAALIDWIDRLEASVPTGLPRIALMGFSQGGAMVTQAFRAQPERFVAGVNCSGFVFRGEQQGDAVLAQRKPPIFWGRDEGDPVITQDKIELTNAWLPSHSTLTAKLYPGIQHSISAEELNDISAFLNVNLPA